MKLKKPTVVRLLLLFGSVAGVLAVVAWRTGNSGEIVPLLFVTAIVGGASYALGLALYLRQVDPERPVCFLGDEEDIAIGDGCLGQRSGMSHDGYLV